MLTSFLIFENYPTDKSGLVKAVYDKFGPKIETETRRIARLTFPNEKLSEKVFTLLYLERFPQLRSLFLVIFYLLLVHYG